LQVGTRSKAERGYALAFDVVQPAAKAEPVGITGKQSVDDVIALLAGACWQHLLNNHAVAMAGSDPEGTARCSSVARISGDSTPKRNTISGSI
jgi:triphosphatase